MANMSLGHRQGKIFARVVAFLRLVRLPNCLMMGFAVIVGETIALRGGFDLTLAVLGYLVGFFLLGASMVINDYYDIEIDRINNPSRPIPSGMVSRAEAKSYAFALAFAGLFTAALINWSSFLVALLATASMVAYNARLKPTGLIGNMIVSANIAVPFVFGGFAVSELAPSLLIFALLAFLSGLGREVIKGIMDVPGDKQRGIRTVAVRYGETKAAYLGAGLFLVAVLLSALPLVYGLVSILYVPFVLLCDLGFLYSSVSLLRKPTARNSRRAKSHALVWMTLGLVAFIAGAFGQPIGWP